MHFDENRTLATQIGTLGASVGQFALPVIITASITGYSLKATVTKLYDLNWKLYDLQKCSYTIMRAQVYVQYGRRYILGVAYHWGGTHR